MNINDEFDKLPKYLTVQRYRRTWYFHPIVFIYENDGCENAYFAMFAKYNEGAHTFDTSKVLLWAKHHTYDGAVKAMLDRFAKSKKSIQGRDWSGKVISGLDLLNC